MLSLSLEKWSYVWPVSISWVSYLKSRLYLQNWKSGASRLNIADFSAGLSRAASLDEQNSTYFKKTPLFQPQCWPPRRVN